MTAAADLGVETAAFASFRKYWLCGASDAEVKALANRLLANDAIEQVVIGPLQLDRLDVGQRVSL